LSFKAGTAASSDSCGTDRACAFFAKRLKKGRFISLLVDADAVALSLAQLSMLLEGIH